MSDALRKTREAYDGLAETYDRANRSIEDIEGILAVSYTHLTLPTTPYV